jgi:hypothetical protein
MTIRRIAACATMLAAPVLIAFGAAAASNADPGVSNDVIYTTPVQHPAFPIQTNAPQPGTQIHHDHQNNK